MFTQSAGSGFRKVAGDPDSSLKDGVRAFWLENKGNLSNDPAEWRALSTAALMSYSR